MADRPVWRGHLRLALVSCPIALHTARRDSGDLHFHLINPETGHRVRMLTVDAETGAELNRGDLVKGYEYERHHYLTISEEDFEQARIESSSTMTIGKFVPAADINPVYFENSYYVVPDGEAGQDVYVVLRDAIAQTGRVALTRVVIARRERAVALMPMGRGLVAHTLHEARDIARPDTLFDQVPRAKPDADMVRLAVQLIERQSAAFDPADMVDRYQARLREVIEGKLKGEGVVAPPDIEPDRGNVVDLMAALKRSLGQTAAAKPARAKPAPVKPGRAKAAPARKAADAKPAVKPPSGRRRA